MNMLKCECAKNWGDVAPLALRVVAGIIFFMHGLQKATGDVSMFSGMLNSLGVPAPEIFSWIVILLEIGGGLALIVGFMTHWISKFLIILMVVAIFLVHIKNGFFGPKGYEFPLLLLTATVSLMITGAGKWSVDVWLADSCCGKCEGGVCGEHGEKTMK
jgi:putative oxidoreductase